MPTKQARQHTVGMLEQCLYQNQCDARLPSVARRVPAAAAHQLGAPWYIPVVPWLAAAARVALGGYVSRCTMPTQPGAALHQDIGILCTI